MIPEKQKGQADAGLLFGVLGVLLLCVFPLSVHDYSSITRFKYLQMLFLTGVCCLTALLFVRAWRRSFRWKQPSRWLLCAYGAFVVLSAFFGRYADLRDSSGARMVLTGAIRYEGLITQVCYLLLFLVFSLHRPHRGILLNACAVAVIVYAAVAAGQYAGWDALELFPAGRSIRTNYEFQGTIGNIDMVSGYLTLVIPLLMVSYVQGLGGWLLPAAACAGVLLEACMEVQSGLLAMAVLAALLISVFLMHSSMRVRAGAALTGMCLCFLLRSMIALPWLDSAEEVSVRFIPASGAWLLAACCLCLATWFFRDKASLRLSGRDVLLLWGILLLAALVVLFFLPVSEDSGMFFEVREILHARPRDSFGSWRWGVWRHTLAVSREHLLMGTGPDMFYYAMRDYLAGTGSALGENFDNPHNLYLAILAGSGLPALLAYLALLASLLIHSFRSEDLFSRALGTSVLLYSIQGFFSFSICLVSPMAWTVFGMACAGEEGHMEAEHDFSR